MDRISDLPGEIIRLIVRFLPADEAACVLVLKRRYRNLYTIIPNLEFDDEKDDFQGTFTDFVTQSLTLLETTTLIKRFSLKYKRDKLVVDSALVNHWLRNVLKRGVIDLKLDIYGGGDNGYELPLEIFTCNTITKMTLGKKFVIRALPKNALLPSLETLILKRVKFYASDDGYFAFEAFLLACPVLKELIIKQMRWEKWNWSRKVSSQSLQRLTMIRIMSEDFYEPEPLSLSFDTPSLVYFEYYDVVPDEYPIVKFDSLVEAKLELLVMVDREWHGKYADDDDDLLSSNPRNLIQGLRNVKILDLVSPVTLEALYFFREAIPVFKNLQRLSFTHDDVGACWRSLPYLLDKAPNLKTLVIRDGMHYGGGPSYVCHCLLGYSCLLSCPIEVMEIKLCDRGTIEELQQVKHFLGKLPCLELLIVNTMPRTSDKEKLRIITDLKRFPRASPNCRVELRCIF